MASPENASWGFDYPLIDNISVAGGDFGVAENGLFWTPQGINSTPSARYLITQFLYFWLLFFFLIEVDSWGF